MNLPAYYKTLTALAVGILGWAGVVIASEASHVTASEWLALGVALATALGVWTVPNEPSG